MQIKSLLNNAPNVLSALQRSLVENANLRKQAEEFMQERVVALKKQVMEHARVVNGVTVATCYGPRIADVVKGAAFALRAEHQNDFIFVAATHEGDKPMLTVALSDNLVKDGMNASAVVREAAKLIHGGGGGQPHFAQAGGKSIDGLSAALDKMLEMLNAKA